jgi:ribosomal protein S18 acetylase RimI-like enzyme
MGTTENQLIFENYNPQKHDKETIAKLIFESDVEMNSLVYGRNPIKVIKALLSTPQFYFLEQYTTLALLGDSIMGIVVAYPASKRKEIDKLAGQGMIKAMGFFTFLRKMALFIRMEKMLGGEIENDGLYIHTICVDGKVRGQNIGRMLIQYLNERNPIMYLYVNADNHSAIRFYEKNGFAKKFHGTMKYKGKELGEYLMRRK